MSVAVGFHFLHHNDTTVNTQKYENIWESWRHSGIAFALIIEFTLGISQDLHEDTNKTTYSVILVVVRRPRSFWKPQIITWALSLLLLLPNATLKIDRFAKFP